MKCPLNEKNMNNDRSDMIESYYGNFSEIDNRGKKQRFEYLYDLVAIFLYF